MGVVRNENRAAPVLRLEYEAFEEMALPLMQEIAAEAHRRLPVTVVRLVHRLGSLEIGEASVAVAVASPHRAEAFAACRFAIDTLKAQVPIWKKELYADGSAWLDEAGSSRRQPRHERDEPRTPRPPRDPHEERVEVVWKYSRPWNNRALHSPA